VNGSNGCPRTIDALTALPLLVAMTAIDVARGLGDFYAPLVGYKRDPFTVITSGVSLGAGLIHAAGLLL
jgi:hypothetical protein